MTDTETTGIVQRFKLKIRKAGSIIIGLALFAFFGSIFGAVDLRNIERILLVLVGVLIGMVIHDLLFMPESIQRPI